MKMKKLFLLLVLCAFSFSIFGCDLFQKEIIDGELLSSYLEKEEQVSKKGFAPVGSASSLERNLEICTSTTRVSIL